MTRKLFSLAIFALLSVAPLAASSVLDVPFDTLSLTAKRVIEGEIVRIVSFTGENGYIYSDVTVIVRNASPRSLEGQPYTFRTIGGEADGRRLFIQGMPRFEVGRQVALFLHDSSDTALGPTVGLWQGVFFIERDATTGQRVMLDAGRRMVVGFEGAKMLRGLEAPKASAARDFNLSDASRAVAVDAFFEKVRAYRGDE